MEKKSLEFSKGILYRSVDGSIFWLPTIFFLHVNAPNKKGEG